jgi:hypothetical protein
MEFYSFQILMNANKISMSVGKWIPFSPSKKKESLFFISRPGYTCKNVPGTYKYYSSHFVSLDFFLSCRCVPQNCTSGEKFNAFYGRCEKIQCQPGFNVTSFGKCIGKMQWSTEEEKKWNAILW